MIHTFELSRELTSSLFEMYVSLPEFKYHKQGLWKTSFYESDGMSVIRLYKFKPRKRNKSPEDVPFHYMMTITVNPNRMFKGDGFHACNVLSFTPDFIRTIYERIYTYFPDLEYTGPELAAHNPSLWLDYNRFKLRRIDYAFDIINYAGDYIKLISRGYAMPRKGYGRYYFDARPLNEELPDDDGCDIDEYDPAPDSTDYGTYYVYYKCNSLHINIYIKGEQMRRSHAMGHVPDSYDFLRIEVQAKKNKLNALVEKMRSGEIPNEYGFTARDLRCFATSHMEKYILDEYVSLLTGRNIYVHYDFAVKLVDGSFFRPGKKGSLKRSLFYIARDGGIASFLAKAEHGDYPEIRKLSTARQYIKDIESLGINPVTIPTKAKIPMLDFIAQSGNPSDNMRIKALPNLVDAIHAYNRQISHDKEHGIDVTGEDIETIIHK